MSPRYSAAVLSRAVGMIASAYFIIEWALAAPWERHLYRLRGEKGDQLRRSDI
jgi:hypothetical protein